MLEVEPIEEKEIITHTHTLTIHSQGSEHHICVGMCVLEDIWMDYCWVKCTSPRGERLTQGAPEEGEVTCHAAKAKKNQNDGTQNAMQVLPCLFVPLEQESRGDRIFPYIRSFCVYWSSQTLP